MYSELILEGEFINGKWNGKEEEYYHNDKLKFEVEWLDRKRNGKSKNYNNNKLQFEGEYLNYKEILDENMIIMQILYINIKWW